MQAKIAPAAAAEPRVAEFGGTYGHLGEGLSRARLPTIGRSRAEVRRLLQAAAKDDLDWRARLASGTNYIASDEVSEIAKEAFLQYFSTNVLLSGTFPSLQRLQRDVVTMTASLLHGDRAVGSVTVGGSESILMGVKSARDRARKLHPEIVAPEMVVPISAHPAFWKAGHYFGLKVVQTPLNADLTLNLAAYREAVTRNTVLLVGSAPSLTLGMVDPIEDMAAIAEERNIGFHVDACVGGFFLPFVEHLGDPVPRWDFRVPGVTTISADLHKFGYAAKPASVVLSRDPDIFSYQMFRFGPPERPLGWYDTPSMTGTRAGGPVAAAWAVMNFLGADGYERVVAQTMHFIRRWQAEINAIPGLRVLGRPVMSVFAYGSDTLDVFAIAQGLRDRGWLTRADSFPGKVIRFMQSLGHEPYVDKYMADLRDVVELVRAGTLGDHSTKVEYS